MSAPRLPQIMFIYPTCSGSPENIGGNLAQAAANPRYLQHGSRSPQSDLAKAFADKDVYRHLDLEKAALDLRDRISPDWKKCPVSEFAGIWFSTSAGNGLYRQWLEKKIPTKAFVGGLMRNDTVSAWYPGELRGKTIEVANHEGGFILLHRVLWKACGMEMEKPTPPTASSPKKVTELAESPTPRSADREREYDRMRLQAARQEAAEREAVLRHHQAQARREEEEKRRVQDRMFSSQAPPFSAMSLDGEMAQTLRGRPGLEFPDALTSEPWEWAAAPPVRESYLSRDGLHAEAPFPESAEALRQARSAPLNCHEAVGASRQLTARQLHGVGLFRQLCPESLKGARHKSGRHNRRESANLLGEARSSGPATGLPSDLA